MSEVNLKAGAAYLMQTIEHYEFIIGSFELEENKIRAVRDGYTPGIIDWYLSHFTDTERAERKQAAQKTGA